MQLGRSVGQRRIWLVASGLFERFVSGYIGDRVEVGAVLEEAGEAGTPEVFWGDGGEASLLGALLERRVYGGTGYPIAPHPPKVSNE